MSELRNLEIDLNSPDQHTRARSLEELVTLAGTGAFPLNPEIPAVNMHAHSFFSFNAYGYSPSSLAWLAKSRGLKAMGIVDFDSLDGVDEFLAACELAQVRGTAGIETRVFVPEYADKAINSPGEPGVCYHMGIGFATGQVPVSVTGTLSDLARRASQRNQDILSRVNGYLHPVSADYERDVKPLSPGGRPTERHMVVAFIRAAERTISDPVAFWAGRLGTEAAEMAVIMADEPRFQNLIRSRLMKRGGVGYVQPASGMFPSLDDFHELTVGCGALPCAAWLDGTTATEQAIEEWLAFLIARGVVALNIIPDRNWNIVDPEVRGLKVRNLHHVVRVARDLDLILNIGTEMNSFGQKWVDDFSAPELAPLRHDFLYGALTIYGHTVMQRALGLGYQSVWAQAHLPSRRERNRFYLQAGTSVPPGRAGIDLLMGLDSSMLPETLLAQLVA